MPFTVTMPKLSPTMESGSIAKWHKKEGDRVESGDLLLEVSTDKATVEHNALDEGFLRKILVPEGGEATVNQPIAIFTESKEESLEGYVPEGEVPAQAAVVAPEPSEQKEPAQKPLAEQPTGRIKVSPLAKKLAAEKEIDLSTLQGTGPGGRIVSRDLEQAKPRVLKPQGKPGAYVEEIMTPIRKVIAKRLQEAKATIPHFYVEQQINAEPLISVREQLSSLDIKVSFNDCIVKACAEALKQHADINSGFNAASQTLIRFQTVDISVAVSTDTGLITPIIRFADSKSVSEISTEIRALANKAKQGKLEPHEFQGGSFTISNMGMYGITRFSAIMNPPQAAILAVGGILDQPVVRAGQVVPGKVLNLTLSVDHRVIDGVAAAKFLKTLQKFLENPISLLV